LTASSTTFEALAELLDALVEAGRSGLTGRFFRRFRFAFGFRFRRGGFASGRFFGARPGFRFFRRFAGLFFGGHAQVPPVSLGVGTSRPQKPVSYTGFCGFDDGLSHYLGVDRTKRASTGA
jgi:hypothetical protein